jgi:hypothetical protein
MNNGHIMDSVVNISFMEEGLNNSQLPTPPAPVSQHSTNMFQQQLCPNLSVYENPMTVRQSNTSYTRMQTVFSGYMTENASNFLEEYEAHLLLQNIDISSPKSVAASNCS